MAQQTSACKQTYLESDFPDLGNFRTSRLTVDRELRDTGTQGHSGLIDVFHFGQPCNHDVALLPSIEFTFNVWHDQLDFKTESLPNHRHPFLSSNLQWRLGFLGRDHDDLDVPAPTSGLWLRLSIMAIMTVSMNGDMHGIEMVVWLSGTSWLMVGS